jgi:hypothetical protein
VKLKLILTAALAGMFMLAFTLPTYAQSGPPGPPDTGELLNVEPDAVQTGHYASCGAQGANLDRAAGESEDSPAYPALEFNHDVQCDSGD